MMAPVTTPTATAAASEAMLPTMTAAIQVAKAVETRGLRLFGQAMDTDSRAGSGISHSGINAVTVLIVGGLLLSKYPEGILGRD
jgi:hypothetical protein